MSRSLRTLLLALPLALGACGSDSNTPVPTIETAVFAPSLNVDIANSTRLSSGVFIRDIAVGTGAPVSNGQTLSMRYEGFLTNGSRFDGNLQAVQPFTFRLGSGQVISGWDLGVLGMNVGGRRQLIIPPALGYGASGQGPIPPNAILVFNVEVTAAQ